MKKSTNKGSANHVKGSIIPEVGTLSLEYITMVANIYGPAVRSTLKKIKTAINDGWCDLESETEETYEIIIPGTQYSDDINICFAFDHKSAFATFELSFFVDAVDTNKLKISLDKLYPSKFSGFINDGAVWNATFGLEISGVSLADLIVYSPVHEDEIIINKNIPVHKSLWTSGNDEPRIQLSDNCYEMMLRGITGPKITKMEIQPQTRACSLKDLSKIPNPLGGLTIRSYISGIESYDPTFLGVCTRDAEGVQYYTGQNKHGLTEQLIAKGNSDWWNPETVWHDFIIKINALTDFNGARPAQKMEVANGN